MPSYFLITRMNRRVIKKQIRSHIEGIMSIIRQFHYRNPISLWPVGKITVPAQNNTHGLIAVVMSLQSKHDAFEILTAF